MGHKTKPKSRTKNRSSQPQRQEPSNKNVAPSVRVSEFKPQPAVNEPLEDLAVFSNVHRELLSAEFQAEATRVGEALNHVHLGDFATASNLLKDIARTSMFADWRLFVRGLISFYQGDLENARQNWSRLDRSRRPSRIAVALFHAESIEKLWEGADQPDPKQVNAVREMRLRPALIIEAKRIASYKHRDPQVVFSVSQVAQLRKFCDQYRQFDSEFVARFSQECVRHCFAQPDLELFEMLTKFVPGPIVDPHWNLHGHCYALMFSGTTDSLLSYTNAFIKTDLPKILNVPAEVKNALASALRLSVVRDKMRGDLRNPFRAMFFSGPILDFDDLTHLVGLAIKDYPKNRSAHQLLIELHELQLEDDELSKKEEEKLFAKLIATQEQFVRFFPNEIDTIEKLLDYYFEEDLLDKASVLVKTLGEQRFDDPQLKALPWKLKMRESMSLCRRKTSLTQARKVLEEAESIWPTWLSKNWLHFLRAAMALREGDLQAFESLNRDARVARGVTQLVGDIMLFAALQSIHLPAPGLKVFREMVEVKTRKIESIETGELCFIGSFFWDLLRTGLTHKGYAIHGSRFGKALCNRFKADPNPEKHAAFGDACRWVADHRLWGTGDIIRLPAWLEESAKNNPKVLVAIADWYNKENLSGLWFAKFEPQLQNLKELARTEPDPYYRYEFGEIAKESLASLAEFKDLESRQYGSASSDDYDDYEDVEDDDDEDNCQCANCRARRARAKSNRGAAARVSSLEVEDDEDAEDDDEDDWGEDSEQDLDVVANPLPKIPLNAQELKDMRRKRQKLLDAKKKQPR